MSFGAAGHVGDSIYIVYSIVTRCSGLQGALHEASIGIEFAQVNVVVVEDLANDQVIIDEAHGQHVVLEVRRFGLLQLDGAQMAEKFQ